MPGLVFFDDGFRLRSGGYRPLLRFSPVGNREKLEFLCKSLYQRGLAAVVTSLNYNHVTVPMSFDGFIIGEVTQ